MMLMFNYKYYRENYYEKIYLSSPSHNLSSHCCWNLFALAYSRLVDSSRRVSVARFSKMV